MFYYKLYGLTLASQFELPLPLTIDNDTVHVTLSLSADIETTLSDADLLNAYQIDQNQNVLFTGPFGFFLVKSGQTLQLKLHSDKQLSLAIQYILGSGMAIILYQRETLVIHSSAVCKDRQATLFVGKSGLGKSSMAAMLQSEGYQLLSDDLSVIHFKNGQPWVYPGHPDQKIATDVLNEMNVPITPDKKTTADGRDKYFHTADAFSSQSMPIKYIYNLLKADIDLPTINQESELRGFHQLYRNSFRFKLIKHLGFSQKHLSLCQQLYKKTSVSFFIRPTIKLHLMETFRVIKEHQEKLEYTTHD